MHIAVGLLVAFLCVVGVSLRRGPRRHCRWRRKKSDGDLIVTYQCHFCGAVITCDRDQLPDQCVLRS